MAADDTDAPTHEAFTDVYTVCDVTLVDSVLSFCSDYPAPGDRRRGGRPCPRTSEGERPHGDQGQTRAEHGRHDRRHRSRLGPRGKRPGHAAPGVHRAPGDTGTGGGWRHREREDYAPHGGTTAPALGDAPGTATVTPAPSDTFHTREDPQRPEKA